MQQAEYMKRLGMNRQEFEQEPIDEFFTNLYILGQIEDKNKLDQEMKSKYGTS